MKIKGQFSARVLRTAAAAVILGIAVLVAATGAAADAPACAADQLGNGRTPILIADAEGARLDQLIEGKSYPAELYPELAIATYPDGSPYTRSNAKDGSITVTGPPGLVLSPKPQTDSFEGGYEFTAPPAPSSLALTVSWIQVLTDRTGAESECAATGTVILPVVSLGHPVVGNARFLPGGFVHKYVADTSEFRVRITPARNPADPTPVYVVLRVRGGATKPPSLRAAPAYRHRLDRIEGSFRRAGLQLDSEGISSTGQGTVYEIVIQMNPFAHAARFGFSVSIEQGGLRLGGMRGGAICGLRFSTRAYRHYIGCKSVGFAARP